MAIPPPPSRPREILFTQYPTSFAVIVTGHTAPANFGASDDPAPPAPPASASSAGAAGQHAPLFPFPTQRSTGIPKNVPGPRTRLLRACVRVCVSYFFNTSIDRANRQKTHGVCVGLVSEEFIFCSFLCMPSSSTCISS